MNELYHYGVKGMKGGVRKSESTAAEETDENNVAKGKLSKYNNTLHTIKGKQYIRKLNDSVSGIKIADISIDGITKHAVERMLERKVKASSVIDAARNPLHVTEAKSDIRGNNSRQAIGEKATIVVGVESKKITSTWPTSRKRVKKYKRGV